MSGVVMKQQESRVAISVFNVAAGAALAAALACSAAASADDKPAPSKHQLLKDCMAKQKASEAGRSKEDMKKTCEDVAKTEKQNADRAEKTNAQ
jgi:hypothetical protein